MSTPLTTGFNHVATLTPDLGRYTAFYEEVFGATVVAETEGGPDHPPMAVVHMGGGQELNVFEVPAESIIGDRTKIGARGRLDHFALSVGSFEALEEVRDRLVARGASPGEVSDFGFAVSVFFRDPDGTELEVAYHKPEVDFEALTAPIRLPAPQRMGDPPV